MGIDLATELPIPLAEVPKLRWLRGRGGRPLNVATVHRWCSRGVRGVRLEYIQRAGTRVTSEEALKRFFRALTDGAGTQARAAPQRDLHAVERALDAAGI
jgi:hypothetical protein